MKAHTPLPASTTQQSASSRAALGDVLEFKSTELVHVAGLAETELIITEDYIIFS